LSPPRISGITIEAVGVRHTVALWRLNPQANRHFFYLLARRPWRQRRVHRLGWGGKCSGTTGRFRPGKLWALLLIADALRDKRIKAEQRHAPQELLPIRGTANLLACSVHSDQTVAWAKVQERVGGIFQFQRRVDPCRAPEDELAGLFLSCRQNRPQQEGTVVRVVSASEILRRLSGQSSQVLRSTGRY
jgi:hypothetical protein